MTDVKGILLCPLPNLKLYRENSHENYPAKCCILTHVKSKAIYFSAYEKRWFLLNTTSPPGQCCDIIFKYMSVNCAMWGENVMWIVLLVSTSKSANLNVSCDITIKTKTKLMGTETVHHILNITSYVGLLHCCYCLLLWQPYSQKKSCLHQSVWLCTVCKLVKGCILGRLVFCRLQAKIYRSKLAGHNLGAKVCETRFVGHNLWVYNHFKMTVQKYTKINTIFVSSLANNSQP